MSKATKRGRFYFGTCLLTLFFSLLFWTFVVLWTLFWRFRLLCFDVVFSVPRDQLRRRCRDVSLTGGTLV